MLGTALGMACALCSQSPDGLQVLCAKDDGQLLLHSSQSPAYGHWEHRGDSVCWKLLAPAADSGCTLYGNFPEIHSFQSYDGEKLGLAGGEWGRYLRVPPMDSLAVMEILPLKTDFQNLLLARGQSLLALSRAREDWFKRWSPTQLLPALSEEALRRWEAWSGIYCTHKNAGDLSPGPMDQGAREIQCESPQGRWILQSRIRTKNGATLLMALVAPEAAAGEWADLLDQVEFR